jgi:hypothetical protein
VIDRRLTSRARVKSFSLRSLPPHPLCPGHSECLGRTAAALASRRTTIPPKNGLLIYTHLRNLSSTSKQRSTSTTSNSARFAIGEPFCKIMDVVWVLRGAKCPVRVRSAAELAGETRLQVLEWLLRAYDEAFCEQCAKEGGSRGTRIARQLFVLGLGGTRLAQCEAFVSASGASEETVAVFVELCQLVELSRATSDEALRAGLVRDLDFPKRAAPSVAAYFAEPTPLFPTALLQKVNLEEQIDAEKLMAQLGALLEKINAKIAALEAQSKLEQQDAKFVDPKTMPQLMGVMQSFGAAIQRFNTVYQSEMALWKVASVKPNMQLADLAEKIHKQQSQLSEYIESFQKSRRACAELEAIGKSIAVTLGAPLGDSGPQLTEEFVAEANRMAHVLSAQ